MTQEYLYIGIAFASGILVSYIFSFLSISRLRKSLKSLDGYLESEKLMKEKLQKENTHLLQLKSIAETELLTRVKELEKITRMMDSDILLLQKSNEETEALIKAKEPAIYDLKVKLIEANNTIARYKAQLGLK